MDTIILVFDIKNLQKHFSTLMQIVSIIEEKNSSVILKETDLNEFGALHYCWIKDGMEHNFTTITKVRGIESQFNNNTGQSLWKLHNLSNLEQVIKGRDKYNIHYYVRVNFDCQEDIKNIQYLVLLLQQFRRYDLNKKMVVFMVPFQTYYNSGKEQQKLFSAYQRYSHYMRFITSRYPGVFFSAFYETAAKKVNIVELSKRKSGVQSTFFPLLEIDAETHSLMSRHCFLNEHGLIDEGEEEYKILKLFDIIEIVQKILEKSITELNKSPKGNSIKKAQIYQEMQKRSITPLEYAIFSVLLSNLQIADADDITNCLEKAESIANGLIQLIENVVLHSENHVGTFTFRIVKNGEEYLQSILENSLDRYSSKILEIDICDANMRESIIDNFLHKLSPETNYFEGVELSVSHFFGSFHNDIEQQTWMRYRTENPVRCLGLERLKLELSSCQALLSVRSNTSFNGQNEHLLFEENYFNAVDFRQSVNASYIPGTQFQIILPMFLNKTPKSHNANIYINGIGNIEENDKIYANAIDYSSKEITFGSIIRSVADDVQIEGNVIYADAYVYKNACISGEDNAKDAMVSIWCQAFDKWIGQHSISDQIIYYLDLKGIQNLESPWGMETLCKGLVASALLQYCSLRCLVLLNGNAEFIKMFFNTVLLSQKGLHSELTIYVQSDNEVEDFLIAGKNQNEIIRNAIQYAYFKGKTPDYVRTFIKQYKAGVYESNKVQMIPYDVIIAPLDDKKTLFETYIEGIADKYLTAVDEAGYFLPHAHMRLGNKVHLAGFYEISILFRKPRIARKIALLIIRSMREEGIDICKHMLFYGYASYSRAILTALVEILRCYQEKKRVLNKYVEFAVYQNDILIQKTLSDISPKIRMYYSRQIPTHKKINIVQIVPISTTLTTFNKMWDMFKQKEYAQMDGKHLIKNYTLFWVRDAKSEDLMHPSSIEKEYWREITDNRSIKTNLIKPYPQYFCCKRVKWQSPLKCEWCYPDNLIDEIALVETDVTSTVPSQQLEVYTVKRDERPGRERILNEMRIVEMNGCIYYGHISRDNNHFQYYIDTIGYFYKQKRLIAKWLEELREKAKEISERQIKDTLNIIVTPQHHTNVEFGYYVNNYYFNGSADIITIDPSKEYRSNIVAKYADVKMAIADAIKLSTRVEFTYVDDTIITGATFRRVNDLLHSLVPEDAVRPLQFDRVFVLVSRLSRYSKKDYVADSENNFMAYVNIDISSIRNFGDSCTMCTLHKNARLFSHRASTKSLSVYWDQKQYKHDVISFDKYTQSEMCNAWMEPGYFRMLCAHYAKKNLKVSENMKETIGSIVKLMLDLKNIPKLPAQIKDFSMQKEVDHYVENKLSPIYVKVFREDTVMALKSYLKVLCRPFFSYGNIYRQAILDLFLVLAECNISPGFAEKLENKEIKISEKKEYLNDYELRKNLLELHRFIKKTIPVGEYVSFVHSYLLEALTDLRSNYVIRYATILRVKALLESDHKFGYSAYEQLIHRTVNSNADETKSLWLEFLLYTGQENTTNMEENIPIKLKIWDDNDEHFSQFWDSLFIDNTRLYYDSMLNFVKKAMESNKEVSNGKHVVDDAVDQLWDDYYIRNLRKFIRLEIRAEGETSDTNERIDAKIRERAKKTARLLYLLKTQTAGGIERYEKLKECIEALLYPGDEIIIFTKEYSGENTEGSESFGVVTDYKKTSFSPEIKNNVKKVLKNKMLLDKGFCIGKGYIVLCIDNNYEQLHQEDNSIVRIQPLFFYVKCDTTNKLRVKLRVRNILMYRHQLLHWIEADFNNNAMPILTQQMIVNRQLIRERAGDHSSRQDIAVTQRLLQSRLTKKSESNKACDQDVYAWLLLRSYVNLRIARLFRNEWSPFEKDMIYTKYLNADTMNGALINLGTSFFGDTLPDLSPKRYFEFVFDMFEFNLNENGVWNKDVDICTLEEYFSKLYGRENNGYYYKQEYIVCIIFDILFNAIKNCRNWENYAYCAYEDMRAKEIFTDNDECMVHFFVLRQEGEKCRMDISIESADETVNYLVFRNRVDAIRSASEVKIKRQKFATELATKETVGMSIQTIQWYTESIATSNSAKAKFCYEWNSESKEAEFVTKLPILKKG